MVKRNFLKRLGLCLISAALCTAAFAACDNSDGKDDADKTPSDIVTDGDSDNSGETGGTTEEAKTQTLTRAEFFTELKKRETASIEAKKWGKADLSMTAVINGETKTWNVTGEKITYSAGGTGHITYERNGSSELGVDIFGFSTYEEMVSQVQTEKYEKIGESIKFTWYAADETEGFSRTMECTFDADGYLTDYKDVYADKTNSSESKATFSNFTGEGEFPSASESGNESENENESGNE